MAGRNEPDVAYGDDIPHELSSDCWCMPSTMLEPDGSTVVSHNAINSRYWPDANDGRDG